jgi:hypothetical protein
VSGPDGLAQFDELRAAFPCGGSSPACTGPCPGRNLASRSTPRPIDPGMARVAKTGGLDICEIPTTADQVLGSG